MALAGLALSCRKWRFGIAVCLWACGAEFVSDPTYAPRMWLQPSTDPRTPRRGLDRETFDHETEEQEVMAKQEVRVRCLACAVAQAGAGESLLQRETEAQCSPRELFLRAAPH